MDILKKVGKIDNIETETDYVLVPNRNSWTDPPESVLVFTKPECYPGEGGNILFMAEHVEWFNIEEYNAQTRNLMP